MKREIEYRKKRIADTEIDVASLMSAQHQSSTLSSYIHKKLLVFYDANHNDNEPEDQTRPYERGDCGLSEVKFNEIKDLYSRVMEECVDGQVRLNCLRYEDLIAAENLVFDSMKLIDDEIGVFYTTKRFDSILKDDGRRVLTKYFDVQEDKPVVVDDDYYYGYGDDDDEEENKLLRFGDDAPGDRIQLFHEERQKFFSIMSDGSPGSLFILPKCFYFPENVGSVRSIPIECIKAAIRPANKLGVALSLLGQGEIRPNHFKRAVLQDIALNVKNIDAFRVVAREMFFFQQGRFFFYQEGIKPHLMEMIEIAEIAESEFGEDDGES